MIKKLRDTDFLILAHACFKVSDLMARIFLTLFLYKILESNLYMLGIYYVIVYFTVTPTYAIIRKISDGKNMVNMYKLSLFMLFLYYSSVFGFIDYISNNIYLFAVFHGVSVGLYWYTYEVIVYKLSEEGSVAKFLAKQSFVMQLIKIFVPVTLGYVIYSESYRMAILIIAIMLFIAFLLVGMIKRKVIIKNDEKLIETFNKSLLDKRQFKVYLLNFIYGFTIGGIFVRLVGVFMYLKVNSEFVYGILESVGAILIAMVLLLFNARNNMNKLNKIIVYLMFFVLCIAIIGVNISSIFIWSLLFLILTVLIALMDLFIYTKSFEVPKSNNINALNYFVFNQGSMDIGRLIGYLAFAAINLYMTESEIIYLGVLCFMLMIYSVYIISVGFVEKRKDIASGF
ncbi:MAG: hypothetical protein N4A47_05650 [Clostridia bacterium]|jgi:YQGE family putative transporter|nr:hypothetical protein [Clostridia bacterium]